MLLIKLIIMISILLEEQNKLAKIASGLPLKLKEDIEISPITDFIQPKKEITVQVYFSKYKFLYIYICKEKLK